VSGFLVSVRPLAMAAPTTLPISASLKSPAAARSRVHERSEWERWLPLLARRGSPGMSAFAPLSGA